jgi:hypothetical protein
VASRPTENIFHWSRRLIVTNRIFVATNGISLVNVAMENGGFDEG